MFNCSFWQPIPLGGAIAVLMVESAIASPVVVSDINVRWTEETVSIFLVTCCSSQLTLESFAIGPKFYAKIGNARWSPSPDPFPLKSIQPVTLSQNSSEESTPFVFRLHTKPIGSDKLEFCLTPGTPEELVLTHIIPTEGALVLQLSRSPISEEDPQQPPSFCDETF